MYNTGNPTLTHVTFLSNSVFTKEEEYMDTGYGGGMCNISTNSTKLIDVIFLNNGAGSGSPYWQNGELDRRKKRIIIIVDNTQFS